MRQNDELKDEGNPAKRGTDTCLPVGRGVFEQPAKKLMNRNQSIPDVRKIKIRAKRPRIRAEDSVKRYQDLLEIARLVSGCMNRLDKRQGRVHKIINFYFYNGLFHWRGRRILIPLPSLCSEKVNKSAFHIRPRELNANPISGIKTFKPSYELSFDRGVK